MRYHARIGSAKNPKDQVRVSFLAKSEKAAKSKLKRLFPGLSAAVAKATKKNPRPRGSSPVAMAKKRRAIKRMLRRAGYSISDKELYDLKALRKARRKVQGQYK